MSLDGREKPGDEVNLNDDALEAADAGGGKDSGKLDFLFEDVMEQFFGSSSPDVSRRNHRPQHRRRGGAPIDLG